MNLTKPLLFAALATAASMSFAQTHHTPPKHAAHAAASAHAMAKPAHGKSHHAHGARHHAVAGKSHKATKGAHAAAPASAK